MMSQPDPHPPVYAPGWPGIEPRWTSSAKDAVGTAIAGSSRVWFTTSHGILNEVYYPRIDHAAIRDLGLIVTGPDGFFSEEKRDAESRVHWSFPGAPAVEIENACRQGRYRIQKQIVCDPGRDVLVQRVRFTPLAEGLRVHALLAPHLGNRGAGNTAWVGDYKGTPMLMASRGGDALALASNTGWNALSVGFVGFSDGWQELRDRGALSGWQRAENGNVAVCGELDWRAADGEFLLVLGFGRTPEEAGQRARASLADGWEALHARYCREWRDWHAGLRPVDAGSCERDLASVSATIVRVHEAKAFPGAMIASLSVPWGDARGDDDLGGYHLVWPRDLVESAGALFAVGARDEGLRVLHHLQAIQEADGHWTQNAWLDGTPYWSGVQLDETALPILLVDLAAREGALDDAALAALWPMVRRAAGFLVRSGPVTPQDRWEEDPGYSPFTLAVQVAALVTASELALRSGDRVAADYLCETADVWNDNIERWTWVRDTPLARDVGVGGYYVRIAPPERADACSPAGGFVPIKNRPPGQSSALAEAIVSPDALALVRFGLRRADDPRMVDTCRVIDHLLRRKTPQGDAWYRYNGDGYGEHDDGAPFDGVGVGRLWPLLTGERAHYELARGRRDEAARLLRDFERFANAGGLFSEQVWDAGPMAAGRLQPGRPTGSATPLVWAHAEYLKLRRSIEDGAVYDLPARAAARYLRGGVPAHFTAWRFNHKCRVMRAGTRLRVELLAPSVVRWRVDTDGAGGAVETRDTGLGVHVADLPTDALPPGARLRVTVLSEGDGAREVAVTVEAP